MSFDVNWDIEKYREEHESDDHWLLRRNFMDKWKTAYPEDRLVCLARVFANIEFMGCRYPQEVMQEVARMSKEVAKNYRDTKKTKLQRTFVSASDAAEDRARGTKREGGIILEGPARKANKIAFVKSGETETDDNALNTKADELERDESIDDAAINNDEKTEVDNIGNGRVIETERELIDYASEFSKMRCLDIGMFRRDMFDTNIGRFVLLVRPWAGRIWNLQSSCQVCGLKFEYNYDSVNSKSSVVINGRLIAEANGSTKQLAKKNIEDVIWRLIVEGSVIVLVKEQFIAHNDSRISVSEVSSQRDDSFGTRVETSVASKMMKLMGWKGGGLGVDAQGIAEPIKPHLQMVNRAGLGSSASGARQMKRAAESLMRRYIASDCLDVDLVFSNDFSKEERAALHIVAKNAHLVSRSYGSGADRFLVVKKKIDPFSLVQAVVEKGGNTPKYQVYIPAKLGR